MVVVHTNEEAEKIYKAYSSAYDEFARRGAELTRLRDRLEQIADVCRDNSDAGCNQAMALNLVLSIATHKGQPCDHET